ncbi:MAG TPA: DNA-processing protein DprA, partial [Candidatus Hydrogenedentes bacterium]|nr:DNA-processing protein DprA [Candidatus Hydrogenedentota bacterium]
MLTPRQKDWLTLAMVPGVGSALFLRLLARYRDPGEVLRQPVAALAEIVGDKVAREVHGASGQVDIRLQEQLMDACGARLVTMECPDYPPSLAEIYDPPLTLFVRGTLLETDHYAVAVVGTRRPSSYGLEQAERIAGDLARRGITVVSGMAEGIDGAAHRGAIQAGGRTIAVLGCGVDEVFPALHAHLMADIIRNGAVISPFPMGAKALKGYFPQRNRIISGLSMGVVVVEAPPGSGSLITARLAAEQGREVFA